MARTRVPQDPAISRDLRRFLDDTTRDVDAANTAFTSTTAGAVPASGGGTNKFLRADGSWVNPVTLFKVIASDETGADANTAQPWFPTAGAVTVEASSTYEFWGRLRLTRAAGTTAHTTSLLFGGTATLTSIDWTAIVNNGDTVDNDSTDITAASVATAVVFIDTSSSATEDRIAEVRGIVRINAAGTFIPQFQYSAAPGGAPTIQQNSYFMLRKLGAGDVTTQGTWA